MRILPILVTLLVVSISNTSLAELIFKKAGDQVIITSKLEKDDHYRFTEFMENNKDIKEFNIKPQVDRFEFSDGHSILLLSRGRLVNLGNATGHSSFVMSTSFTNQVLAQIALWKDEVDDGLQVLPPELDEEVARLHLDHLDIHLTQMTDEQSDYIGIPKKGPFKPDRYRY